jgi:hypothetical protein
MISANTGIKSVGVSQVSRPYSSNAGWMSRSNTENLWVVARNYWAQIGRRSIFNTLISLLAQVRFRAHNEHKYVEFWGPINKFHPLEQVIFPAQIGGQAPIHKLFFRPSHVLGPYSSQIGWICFAKNTISILLRKSRFETTVSAVITTTRLQC